MIVGDVDADVFTGLAISIHTFGADRFAETEHVRGIYADRVDLALTKGEIESLPEHTETPAVRLRPARVPAASSAACSAASLPPVPSQEVLPW